MELLLARGRRKGFLTYEEMGRVFTKDAVWSPYLEDLLSQLEEEGIKIIEEEVEREVDQGVHDSVTLYLKEISNFPLLSKEEERELAKQIELNKAELKRIELELNLPLRKIKSLFMARREKDKGKKIDFSIVPGISALKVKRAIRRIEETENRIERDRKKFIGANLRLVVKVARRYHHPRLSFLDIIAEGNLGLMKAVDKFDYKAGHRFSTYAVWWIRHSIGRALINKGQTIRIPVYLSEIIDKCMKVAQILSNELGREPTLEEIAHKARIPLLEVLRAANTTKEPISLEAQVCLEGKDKLSDTIEDRRRMTPEKNLFLSTLNEKIGSLLKGDFLGEREKEIIKLRYGFDGRKPLTLEKIGESYGISRERVRQIEEKALSKLRKLEVTKELKDFLTE
ncbi:sigma-70 family RNA polymerase sigma factor [bacterium]|nr:sigma-70 family RNA polymerase sigma factor [bacterium]